MSTLRSRLLRSLFLGLVLILGAWSVGLYVWLAGLLRQNHEVDAAYIDVLLRERIVYLRKVLHSSYPTTNWVNPENIPDVSGPMTRMLAGLNPHVGMRVLDAGGRIVSQTANMPDVVFPSSALPQLPDEVPHTIERLADSKGRQYFVATCVEPEYPHKPVVAYIQASLPAVDTLSTLRRLRSWLVSAWLMVLAATLLLAWQVTRPWRRLVSGISNLATGFAPAASLRLMVPERDPELAALAQGVNRLFDKYEEARQAQQRFVADAAHEICTPLALLRGEVELMLRRPRLAEEYQAALRSNQEEIERLARLAEQMLTLAAADSQSSTSHHSVFPLVEASHDATDRLQPSAEAKGVTLQFETAGQPCVLGDRGAIVRVVWNLVENAVQHTPKGETVTVRIALEAGQAVLAVSDTGPGIPEAHLPRLFERFYRVDKARSRATGGAGLGLSIVKSIVEAHGGAIEVASRLGHGSTFTVRLPAMPAAAP